MSSNDRFVKPGDTTPPSQTSAQEEDRAQMVPSEIAPPPLDTHARLAGRGSRANPPSSNMVFHDLTWKESDLADADAVVQRRVLSRGKQEGLDQENYLVLDPAYVGDDDGGGMIGGGGEGAGGRESGVDSMLHSDRNTNKNDDDVGHNAPGNRTVRRASSANQPTRPSAAERVPATSSDRSSSGRDKEAPKPTPPPRESVAGAAVVPALGLATAVAGRSTTGGYIRYAGGGAAEDSSQLQTRPGAAVVDSSPLEEGSGAASFQNEDKVSASSPGTIIATAASEFALRSEQPPPPDSPARPRHVTQQASLSNGPRVGDVRSLLGCNGAVLDVDTEAMEAGARREGEESVARFVSTTGTAQFGRTESASTELRENDAVHDRSHFSGTRDGSSGSIGRDWDGMNGLKQQQSFAFADGGLEVGGSTAAAETGNSPDIDRVLAGGCGGRGRHIVSGSSSGATGGGCNTFSLNQDTMTGPASASSQVLHVVLAFAVFSLVAFHKAGEGVSSRSHLSAGSAGGRQGFGVGSRPASGKRSSKGSGSGTGSSHRNSTRPSSDTLKRRRSGSDVGFSVKPSPLARRLRAAWSRLWYAAEKDLATRWHAAGQALAALRKAWAALWVPPPHAEADVLAEALASSPRFSYGGDHGHRSVAGEGGGMSDRRRQRSRNVGRSRRGMGGGSVSSPTSTQEARISRDKSAIVRRKLGLNYLNLWGFRPLAGPGGSRGSRSPKFLLVLDLDETLVHCSPHPLDSASRRLRNSGSGTIHPDLKVEMRGGAPSDRPECIYTWKRPHLDVFLDVVSRWYEIAVFTSGRQCYAEVREHEVTDSAWDGEGWEGSLRLRRT